MARDRKIINLVIVTNEPFPIGMAATNRILSYSKGLVELGHSVNVLCLRPAELEGKTIFNYKIGGSIDGIKYSHTSGTTKWPSSKIKKLTTLLFAYINISKKIIAFKKTNQIEFLLLVSNEFLNINYFFLLSKILRIKYLQEKSEFPFVLNHTGVVGKVYSTFYVNYVYKLFDGMIIMTKPLLNYFRKKTRKRAKLLHLPMTVDIERFQNESNIKDSNEKYLAYVGNMGSKKDGVDILIKSFKKISDKFPTLKMILIGEASDPIEAQYLKNLADELLLSDSIVFSGRVNRDQIPYYLKNATILCLARPSSLQASGGFPTKLGEYLATGNPVVVTRVGEISDYLIDNESAFLAEADNVDSFSSKLDYALSNPEIASQIGENGKKVALANFNYKIQSQKMADYLMDFRAIHD